jgi:hypothetical protein
VSRRVFAAIVGGLAAAPFAVGLYAHGNVEGGWTSYSPTPPGWNGPFGPGSARWWWLGSGAVLLLGAAAAPLIVRKPKRR